MTTTSYHPAEKIVSVPHDYYDGKKTRTQNWVVECMQAVDSKGFRITAKVEGEQGIVGIELDVSNGKMLYTNGKNTVTSEQFHEVVPHGVYAAMLTAYNTHAVTHNRANRQISSDNTRVQDAEARADHAEGALGGFIDALTHSSLKLRAEVLLDGDGAPTALYQSIMDAGQDAVNGVFRSENWEGAEKSELTALLGALPEELRTGIPNRQTLIASVGRQSRAVER